MSRTVVAGTVRTAMGRFGGALSKFTAAEMGGVVGREALRRAGVEPQAVDAVVVANARQAGTGPNLGRQLVPGSGLPLEVPGYTINMACGSGLKALELAIMSVEAEHARCILVIGVEAMSRIPYMLDEARWGYRLGSSTLYDALYRDGFICALSDQHMGLTAENLAEQYGLLRERSDSYAVLSHLRAVRAVQEGALSSQIIPITIPQRRGPDIEFHQDECLRPDTSEEKLSRLAPVFKSDGQVTAGNASSIADGAAALVVMSRDLVEENGLDPSMEVLGFAEAGVDPNYMGIGPVPAVRRLLSKMDLTLHDFSAIEINEAFAVQVLACLQDLGLDPEDINPQGGAIAMGHPVGMTGVRMMVALDHYLKEGEMGLATMCINGGMGLAACVRSLGSPSER